MKIEIFYKILLTGAKMICLQLLYVLSLKRPSNNNNNNWFWHFIPDYSGSTIYEENKHRVEMGDTIRGSGPATIIITRK